MVIFLQHTKEQSIRHSLFQFPLQFCPSLGFKGQSGWFLIVATRFLAHRLKNQGKVCLLCVMGCRDVGVGVKG